jgi:hypothetical protein
MAQIFHPSTNTISRVSIVGAVFIVAGGLWLIAALNRSSYATEEGVVLQQPIQFSHEHHVGGLGLDCRYCHTSVEVSPLLWKEGSSGPETESGDRGWRL